MTWAPHIEEFVYISNISLIPLLKVKGLSSRKNIISKISSNDEVGVLLQANHVNGLDKRLGKYFKMLVKPVNVASFLDFLGSDNLNKIIKIKLSSISCSIGSEDLYSAK